MIQTMEDSLLGLEGRPLRYTLIQAGESPSRALCFVFPGASYSFDKPYLYYSTMLFLRKQVDIVHVHYSFGQGDAAFWNSPFAEKSAWLQADAKQLVSHLLAKRAYEQIFFLGKSIGTVPIACGLLHASAFSRSSAVLLTPLLTEESLAADLLAVKQHILLVSGTQDPYYHPAALEKIACSRPNVRLYLPEGAKHSLDVGLDVSRSLGVLQSVMDELDSFVGQQLDTRVGS
ncbi:alpha/beta hydrolase [Brevibacillus sp. SAFN-007a]|uniref:alpha/beta hydrolase n=1 Tax=Brevibacillus sp. SAFN-007a TaxID=3436862 RepID=UPI003F7FF842